MPSTVSTMPVTRFCIFGVALLANRAEPRAPIKVARIHTISARKSGFPPMAKCEIAPVRVRILPETYKEVDNA